MGRQIPRGFTQRFAKIPPTQDQQPDVLTRDLGRKDKADPNEALFQALTSYLYQRHEDQNGLEYPFVAVLIEPSPGQLQVLDHDAYAELVATDTTYSAHFRHKWTFWDSRHAVALKRYDSDKEVLLSVEELLNEGKSKSGANGLPFYYLPPEHSTTLKEVTYYLHDHLGNMRLTYSIPCVAGTQVPTLLHAADYYPYGSILRQHINGAQEKYLTTHHERDLETGLDYRGARYYDSDVARFLSLDPLAAEYASWSPYNYVMGNSISLIDPDGRKVVFHKDASREFKRDFAQAVKRLNQAGASSMLAKLHASDQTYTIKEGLYEGRFFHEANGDNDANTILWDSRMTITTTNDVELSPETILMHEVDHALRWDSDPEGYVKDLKPDGKNPYDNKEEERVIKGSEQEVARKLGEIKEGEVTREDHGAKKITTVPKNHYDD